VSFIRYAFTNAVRLCKETLPLLLLTALTVLTATVSSILTAYSDSVFDEIKNKYEVAVSLFYSPVLSQTANVISEPPDITYELIDEISDHPSVKMACFSYVYEFDTPWLWQVNFQEDPNDNGDVIVQGGGVEQIVFIGITDSKYSDIPEITSGRGIMDMPGADQCKRVVIISEYVSREKNLVVGDKIQVSFAKNSSEGTEGLLKDSFEVIGIYKDCENHEQNLYFYIPLSLIESNSEIDNSQNIYGNIYFVLNSPDCTAEFIRSSIEKFKSLPLAMEADDYEYKREVYPSSTARELNRTICIVSCIAGIVLTVILGLILIRVRMREITMLRKIGCSKSFVILSYTFEKISVAFVGILIGVALGSICVVIYNKDIPMSLSAIYLTLGNVFAVFSATLISTVINATSAVCRTKFEVE